MWATFISLNSFMGPVDDSVSTNTKHQSTQWGERNRRVHTKRVRIQLYDCEHCKLRSQCTQGCGGGGICEHGKQNSQCTQDCGGGTYCEHGATHSLCMQGCGGQGTVSTESDAPFARR